MTEDRVLPPTLELDDVSIRYGRHWAVRHASLRVASGELMALVGPSGCGKSSLLAAINRMTDLLSECTITGDIRVGGDSVLDAQVSLPQLRRRVGMVFQQPNPFPLSIADNLHFPLREHGIARRERREQMVERALRDVGLWTEVAGRLDRSALTLSGGQQQRLCIARALILAPDVLLLDEPCSALDPIATASVEALIRELKGRFTMLMVTHNLAQARRLADSVSVCWVEDGCGCVVESGGTEHIFTTPSHPVTRAYCQGLAG
ncbi:phosphate ABC transporter ATP-binding protein [Aromatoleum bremense]|uniref:ATP-binding cassette domain-containing protein n=1 Tax=Aromatoleum bremense TaxID=76115 RepID=A0ABX1NVS7_9RHOO|nr:phosphate ABC transporter ATP-binding protein [Aromatoleum bremense]NMG16123.1 ATP-binding cassette domain-containing protein [Aromatoleum bremense]QTQ30185.1 Phosphate import ATP-binding protein [Aromatoleum bremense]